MVRVWVVRFSVQVMPSPHWPDTISSPAGMASSVGARVGQKEVGSGSGPGAGCAFPAISAAAMPMAATASTAAAPGSSQRRTWAGTSHPAIFSTGTFFSGSFLGAPFFTGCFFPLGAGLDGSGAGTSSGNSSRYSASTEAVRFSVRSCRPCSRARHWYSGSWGAFLLRSRSSYSSSRSGESSSTSPVTQ